MAFAQTADRRSIPGAVATIGVSDRVDFLRKTYAHLGLALVAWAVFTAGMMKYTPAVSFKMLEMMSGKWSWLMVIGLFMLVSWGSQRLAESDSSRGLQYVGLGLAVVLQSLLLQPLIWMAIIKLGGGYAAIASAQNGELVMSAGASKVLFQATGITAAIFLGLTATVFVTKKDFSFMRGALSIATIAIFGIGLLSVLFGFSMGMLYAGAIVLLMAGYILYETSTIMRTFPPTHHVAAALMLFGTVATLFRAILSLLLRSRD
jgi:FtsH-binding integral membrane protein